VPSSTRDKDATWRTLGTLCRELDWSRPRLIQELQNGLRYRTVPPGRVIDWHDFNVLRWLNVEASEVSFYEAREQSSIVIGPRRVTIGIEVLPADAEVPAPPASVPAASPAPSKTVSQAALRNCILTIKAERPNDPPDEEELWAEVERRLGAAVSRDRIRHARDEVAPEFKLPPGRPRKSAQ
jgi:hypothetical protein